MKGFRTKKCWREGLKQPRFRADHFMPFLLLLILLGCAVAPPTPPPDLQLIPPPGPLTWDPPSQYHTATNGEVGARFTFKVVNNTSAEVVITDVSTSCGCTVAQMPSNPWRLTPHETNKLEAVVDLRDKTGVLSPPGVIYKHIYVTSTNGTNDLTIAITIMGGMTNNLTPAEMARLWGQQLASVDHQAVFKTDCVRCHLVPAFGKTGEELFHTTCGICHESEHRATMVPDLSALKTGIDTNYWRNWVTYGKAGTLMPGFAATLGGPLDDAQIDSLVEFLPKQFPRPLKAAPKPNK